MNKLNRILSILICFAMVVISVPVFDTVSADNNFATEFVLEENTEYASFEDAKNWSFPGSEYADVGVDEEGNITYTQTKQTIYVNGSQNQIRTENLVYTLPESVVAEDEANRTKITTNNYTGTVVIELVYDYVANDSAAGLNQKEDGSASGKISGSYSLLAIGDGTTNAIHSRVSNKSVAHTNSSQSTFGAQSQFVGTESGTTNAKIVYTINTDALTVKAEGGGRVAETTFPAKIKYISQISLNNMQRMGEGTKATIDSLNVAVTPAYTDAEITMLTETLPAKLVDDVHNVTDDINLPTGEGIVWSSSNPAAISATGKVTKKVGETQEVTLTATVTVDGVTYKKSYTMTVAEGEEITEPEVPAGDKVSFTDEIDYTSFADATGWSLADNDYVEAEVRDGKIYYIQKDYLLFNSKGAQNTATTSPLVYTFPYVTVAEDADLGTRIKTNAYKGAVDVAVTYDINQLDPQGNKELDPDGIITFAAYYTTSVTNKSLASNVNSRTYKGHIVNYISTTTFPKPNSIDKLGTENRTVRYAIDTNEKTVNVTVDGSTVVSKATLPDSIGYVSHFQLYGPQRHLTGSYVAIDKLAIEADGQSLSEDELLAINALVPEKLVDGVVSKNFEVPVIDGVTWSSTDDSIVTADGKITKSSDGEKTATLVASFAINGMSYTKEYDITVAKADNMVYYYVDGEEYNREEIVTGNTATAIAAPTKEGKTFLGWFEEGATESFDFNTAISGDVKLYAKYEISKYNIYFRVDSFIREDLTITVSHGEKIGTLPEVPAKEGSTSIGWVISGTTDTLLTEDTVAFDNIYVDASYGLNDADAYTVTFMADGEVYHTERAWPGYTFAFPEAPTKENHTFAYWERNGAEFKETDVMLEKDITLTAVFNPNPIKVSFYIDETTHYKDIDGYYNVAFGALPAAPANGDKAFKYWELENGERFTEDYVVTTPVKVIAQWDEPNVIVNEDITKYTSLTDGLIQFEDINSGYTTLSFDKGLKMSLVKWEPLTDKGAQNSTSVLGLAANFRAMVDSDDASRTKTYMNRFVGEYEIEYVYDIQTVRVKEHEGVSLTEAYMHFNMGARADDGTYSTAPFSGRLRNFAEGGQSFSLHGYDANKTAKAVSVGMTKDVAEHKLTVHFNTYTDVATARGDNNTVVGGDLVWNATPNYINALNVSPILRLGVGTYFKLKNVKVTEYYTDIDSDGYKDTKGLIDMLPDSLVEDPYAVTENIMLPQIEGIEWTTSDRTIIDADGTVSRWYDSLDVILTATATSDEGYEYSKEYLLTVKPFELEKAPIEIEMNNSNWSFANRADQQEARYSFDGNNIKVEKVTNAEDPTTVSENKTYFAYYDLYSNVEADEYSTTSTNTYAGVYDIELDIENGVTSTTPMIATIGYKNGESFFSTVILKFSKNTISLAYPNSGETLASAVVYPANLKDAKIKVRIDADNKLISVWCNDKIAVKNASYVSPFPAATGIDMFSSIRIGVDTNNNPGDYIIVKDINMEKITSDEIADVNAALNAATGISVYNITNTPEYVAGNLKSLPSKIGEYSIEWASDSNQVDVTTGEVFFDETEKDVVVTAYIGNKNLEYPVVVRKDFKLHIRAKASDVEYGEYLINSLGRITNQDYNNIRYDLNLPASADITWSSSDTSIIGTDGKINANATIYAPTKVVITANAYGSKKEYVLTVAPRTAQNTIYTGFAPAVISYGSYTDLKMSGAAVTTFDIKGNGAEGKVNITDENGNIVVSTVIEGDSFYFDYNGSVYTPHSLAEGVKKSVKIVTLPENNKLAIWVDGVLTDDYVTFKASADHIALVKTSSDAIDVSNLKISTDDYGLLALNIDNLNYYGEIGSGILSDDITLPVASITNADVVWESANTSIITNTGDVTASDKLTYTTLKFTIKDNLNSKVYIEKTFDIIVECDEAKNIAKNASVSVSKLENLTYPKTNVNDNNYESVYRIVSASTKPSDIVFDFGKNTLVNTMLLAEDAQNIRNYTIYASKDNSNWTSVYSGDMANVTNKTVKFDTTSARYLKLTIETSNASIVDVNEIKFYLFISAEELAALDLGAISIPSTTSKDLTLATLGENGTVIKWTSSHENVISTTGKLTKPEKAVTVTLTATAEGTDVSRTFEVYVSGVGTSGPQSVGGGGGGGGASGGIGGANANVTVGNDITKPVYTETTEEVKDETSATVYSDVKSTDWFAEDVLALTEKGILSGDGTGKFNPQDKVTREQFLKMLVEAADIETDNAENTFADVVSGSWYENYVLTAKKIGIVNGMSDTEFGIGAAISRQDMAVLIERLINIKGIEVEKAEVSEFADAEKVSSYAKDAVANMKAIGLIQGYNNMYNPTDNLTRAEAATVIASLLEIIEK